MHFWTLDQVQGDDISSGTSSWHVLSTTKPVAYSSPSPLMGEGRGEGDISTNQRARQLRLNSTDAEKRLWKRLRAFQLDGFYFRRQVSMGPYFVDFVCHKVRLIVELDGGQHALCVDYDQQRTDWLNRQGYNVIRFWNNEVMENIEGVLLTIRTYLFEAK